MVKTYTDGRLLFLSDAHLDNLTDTASIPVISGWEWKLSGSGRGHLMSPDGVKHCEFDLLGATIAFEPDGEAITAPGLSAELVQEMGEKYAYDLVFSDAEKQAFDEHLFVRENTKKQHDRSVYDSLKGVVQLEYKNHSWLGHVDTVKVKSLTGIESKSVLSATNSYRLFNQMAETLHASPLRDPSGYMALKGNMYEFLHTEYRNQYENILQAIDNQMVDGTGYGVAHVLDTLQSVVRKNVSEYLPKGENYGDLRFVEATDDRKDAARNFVRCRVSKTLTYEKKRSYEKSALEKTDAKYVEAGERLRNALFPDNPAPQMNL